MSENRRNAHLVGSVNLQSSDDVFDAVARHLGDRVRSVPDGETGERGIWIAWEAHRIAQIDGVRIVREHVLNSPVAGRFTVPVLEPAEGLDVGELDFGPFRYLQHATTSYQDFKVRRDKGQFGPSTRFQVSLPTPMAFSMLLFPGSRREVLPLFERDLAAEVAKITDAVPHCDLALQWDVASETATQERFRDEHLDPTVERWPLEEATEAIARISASVPPDVRLGVHLCYGDAEGEHGIQPRSLAVPVDIANSLSSLLAQRLDWVHMPVPIERNDDAYFAPLQNLRLGPETLLHLGLLHKEDGLDGARRRIAAATKYVKAFGVATECGMGREPRGAIDGLLALHREATLL